MIHFFSFPVTMSTLLFLFITALSSASRNATNLQNTDENAAKAFLARYDKEFSILYNEFQKASWNFKTNITDENSAKMAKLEARISTYNNETYIEASSFNTSTFSYDTKRLLSKAGSRSLTPQEMDEISDLLIKMSAIYGSHKVCKNEGNCLSLEPELEAIMDASTNASERLWAWKGWHEGVGRSMRPFYIRNAELKNRLARLKNYEDYGDEWRQEYETKDLEPIVLELYRQVDPLYRQLHAYIRRQLFNTYGPKIIYLKGPLPAHLLGDMWGRFWSGLNNIAQPYKNKTSVDPTPAMIEQNYTVRRMFEMGDDFFKSMGLKPLPDAFYNLSLLEKPSDPNRKLVCHPSGMDFKDGKDFRVKMCTRINFDHFSIIHHELGHLQYYMQYAHLPIGYRHGANGGFHEAIGELLSMSVATTKHLHTIGLLNAVEDDPEVEINFLFKQALRTVSTLPFHLVQDTWRWKFFRGEIPIEELNQEYWNQKIKLVGVAPPIPRDPQLDLDITPLIHIPYDVPMIYYFTRTIMQYQFAETLCKAANHVGPLHKCDFYNSTEAGSALARMMRMGSSRPWPDAMEALTGQREMSAVPLLNYFQPLMDWLEKENTRNGEFIGWEFPKSPQTSSFNQPTPEKKNKPAKNMALTLSINSFLIGIVMFLTITRFILYQ